jgi:adenylate cyclase
MVLAKEPGQEQTDLRAPMSQVLETLSERLALLQKYEARFGPLTDAGETPVARAVTTATPTTATAAVLAPPAPAPAPPAPATSAPASAVKQQLEAYFNGLQVATPPQQQQQQQQTTSGSGSGSASAGSGADTPESSPY